MGKLYKKLSFLLMLMLLGCSGLTFGRYITDTIPDQAPVQEEAVVESANNKNDLVEPVNIPQARVGIGVTFLNLQDYVFLPSNSILVTIDLNEQLRLEPSLGLTIGDEVDDVTLGFGIFARESANRFNMLYGGRASISSQDFYSLGPVLAGEYYFIDQFSIGAEAQLKAVFGNDTFYLITNSNILIRFYFK